MKDRHSIFYNLRNAARSRRHFLLEMIIFRRIKIEIYVLLFFISLLLIFYFLLLTGSNWLFSIKKSFENLIFGARYFSFAFYFIYFYIFLRLFFSLGDWLTGFIEKRNAGTPFFDFKRMKSSLFIFWPFLKTFLFLTVFFTLVTLTLGLLAVHLQERLVNDLMMEIDKSLFGFYPALKWAGQAGFLRFFDFLIIHSFSLLGLVIGLVWIIFYFNEKREFFSKYIIAMSLAVMIGFIGWFIWPVNSPQNVYLNNVYGKNIEPRIKQAADKYQPSQFVSNFQKESGVLPGSAAPISTLPSMHVAWAIIIVYYLFQFRKKTIFISLPWFFFSSFGTVYLAQHYFIDILAAAPVAVISILIANLLVKLEKRYYQNNLIDQKELEFKNQVKADFYRLKSILKLRRSK